MTLISPLDTHNTLYLQVAEKVKEFFHNEGIHSTTIQPEFVVAAEPSGSISSADVRTGEISLVSLNMFCPGLYTGLPKGSSNITSVRDLQMLSSVKDLRNLQSQQRSQESQL